METKLYSNKMGDRTNMKRLLILGLVFCIFGLFCGCDAGLAIVDLEIITFPERIVYVAGVDDTIDLTGGTCGLILAQTPEGEHGIPVEMTEWRLTISDNVDFSTPGVYTVRVAIHNGEYQEFPVQVIDELFFQEIASQK